MNISVERRFSSHVLKTDTCWLWIGAKKNERGYGAFWLDGKRVAAHRASFVIHRGQIPRGLRVCHTCDNPSCVRPDHLFSGTDSDNMRDCAAKGRCPTQVNPSIVSGENNGQAILSGAQVMDIRNAYFNGERAAVLADRYGVHHTHINRILTGRKWKSVGGPIRPRMPNRGRPRKAVRR